MVVVGVAVVVGWVKDEVREEADARLSSCYHTAQSHVPKVKTRARAVSIFTNEVGIVLVLLYTRVQSHPAVPDEIP